ncbi:MAG: hypothetical protein VX278_19005 [Myxococcota bacterium]|nr:hypothetical protein [Myxococcota bacterium]
MASYILIMTIVAAGLLIAGLPFFLPTKRWDFEFKGYNINIKNYAAHEKVYIDGVKQNKTRTSPFRPTHAEHTITLPNGENIDIFVDAHGATVTCQAFHKEQLIYDSLDRTLSRRKSNQTSSDNQIEEDPRWTTAQVLLKELHASEREEVVIASQKLQKGLRVQFDELKKIHAALAAYETLGQTNDGEMEERVAESEQRVQQLLRLLQELHFNSTSNQGSPPAPEILDVIMQLKAEREVEDRTRSKSLQRTKKKEI